MMKPRSCLLACLITAILGFLLLLLPLTSLHSGRPVPSESQPHGAVAAGTRTKGGLRFCSEPGLHCGNVPQHISVAVVFVGTHPFQAELRRFYSDLVSAESRWFSVLGQYSSGPLSGQVDDVISRDGLGDLDPGQFVGQALLARPRHPNAATYVALHLGSDVSYDAGGCALHFSARVDNQTVVRVGVVPFASASTCVRGLDALASVQQASAHELAEAITNGVDGESAWSSHGFEAADLCNGQTESVVVHGTEHTLHRIWSNCDTACVVASECATRS